MLRAIFGPGPSAGPPRPSEPPKDARGDPIQMTPSLFDHMFGEEQLPPNHRRKIRRKLVQADG